MDTLFNFKTIEELSASIPFIRDVTDESGVSIVRGIVTSEEIWKIRKEILLLYNPDNDFRVSGHYTRGMKDFQRLDLGEYAASSRFARYLFFFPWNNNDSFRSINNLQMELFNRLADKPDTFGSTLKEDTNPNRFRVSFVLQYPKGGGFMSRHHEKSGQEAGDKAYVVYLALTTRGEDFKEGGAYVYKGEERIDIEEYIKAGDLVIYRGDRDHGVANIDPTSHPELKGVSGRMILTTVVKYFKE